ncbi:MAG: DUF2007 domain-containing protein [Spirochaetaceae bacterium]|nr:DUF2007 domain-containing protein [Spirochaetaceae bacterium]
MAEIYATSSQDEALVLKSLIESAGIEAELSGEHTMNTIPIYFTEGGCLRIIVRDEDAEDALAVVAQYQESKASPAPTQD